jgi:cephalosporin hydroxylase
MSKFPEDLRVYEHLLWASSPEIVIDLGVQHGGSALWFRDRLDALKRYRRIRHARVVGVDVDMEAARHNLTEADPAWEQSITLMEGDVRDAATVRRVRDAVPSGASCFLVEDSAHVYETTMASLIGLATCIQPGGYLVVEDGCVDVDAMRPDEAWPRGVLPAVGDWLRSPAGAEFAQRRDLELYGLTCHPGGFLQRRPAQD